MGAEPVDEAVESLPVLADELGHDFAGTALSTRGGRRCCRCSDEMIKQLYCPFVAQMPEESAAITATLEPDLMQYMARGLVVDLRMADDHVAEFRFQDITVANRAQFIDQPPKVRL